jgi:hypothetical protein
MPFNPRIEGLKPAEVMDILGDKNLLHTFLRKRSTAVAPRHKFSLHVKKIAWEV